ALGVFGSATAAERCDARGSCAPSHSSRRFGQWRNQRGAEIPAAAVLRVLVARRTPLWAARSARGGRPHADAYRARRHLRSSRRRLLALQRRRALARAAFREDALRQWTARGGDDRGLAREEIAALRHSHC